MHYFVNKLRQNVSLETWTWRQIVTSQTAHTKYKWPPYDPEPPPPNENFLRTPLPEKERLGDAYTFLKVLPNVHECKLSINIFLRNIFTSHVVEAFELYFFVIRSLLYPFLFWRMSQGQQS